MVFIANQDIDKYKKGDEVPEDIAKVWQNMYLKSPVDEKKEKPNKPSSNNKKIKTNSLVIEEDN